MQRFLAGDPRLGRKADPSRGQAPTPAAARRPPPSAGGQALSASAHCPEGPAPEKPTRTHCLASRGKNAYIPFVLNRVGRRAASGDSLHSRAPARRPTRGRPGSGLRAAPDALHRSREAPHSQQSENERLAITLILQTRYIYFFSDITDITVKKDCTVFITTDPYSLETLENKRHSPQGQIL